MPADGPVSHITDDMVERAAKEIDPSGLFASTPQVARKILEAALAGCPVGDLPEPDIRYYAGSARWDASARRIVAKVDEQGRPYVLLDEQIWLDGEAESVGLALVAAAREARRLAGSVSPKGDNADG